MLSYSYVYISKERKNSKLDTIHYVKFMHSTEAVYNKFTDLVNHYIGLINYIDSVNKDHIKFNVIYFSFECGLKNNKENITILDKEVEKYLNLV